MRARLPIVLALVVAVAGCARKRPASWSGFVDAPVAAVAAQVAGQLAGVEVREGERVHKGQLLARLDARERTAMVAEAEANLFRARQALAEAERNVKAVEPTVRGAEADIAQKTAEMENAQEQFDRLTRLLAQSAATQEQLDAARNRLNQARAAVAAGGATRLASRGRVAASLAAVRTAAASVMASEAALALARVQLAETEIRSPFEGLVVEQNLQPGEWAAPGTPVISVEDLRRQWVRLDVDETALGDVHVGDAAEVRVVAFPGQRWRGHVIEVGAEAEFALNRDVKRGRPDVRTFRVRVALDQIAEALRPGMTAEVTLEKAK